MPKYTPVQLNRVDIHFENARKELVLAKQELKRMGFEPEEIQESAAWHTLCALGDIENARYNMNRENSWEGKKR